MRLLVAYAPGSANALDAPVLVWIGSVAAYRYEFSIATPKLGTSDKRKRVKLVR